MHPTRKSCGVFVAVALAATIGGFVAYEQRVKPGDTTGLPPLHAAVALEDFAAVRKLLDSGAEIDQAARDGNTALHHARSARMVEFLLARGADRDARNQQGETPLHNVHMPGALSALLAAGAAPNARDRRGETALHDVPGKKLVRILALAGADIDAQDRYGMTPVHSASNPEVIEALLAHGADQSKRDRSGATPLHHARSPDAVLILVEAGASLQTPDDTGRLPLHAAKSDAAARQMLELGADPDAADAQGRTALMGATAPGRVDVLVDAGADLSATCDRGWSALEHAMADMRYEVGTRLLDRSCPPSVCKELLKHCRSVAMNETLIRAGVDPKPINLAGIQHVEGLSRLLALGVPADPPDPGLPSALTFAESPEIAGILIKAGADVNRRLGGSLPGYTGTAASVLLNTQRFRKGTLPGFHEILLPHLDFDAFDYLAGCQSLAELNRLLVAGAKVDHSSFVYSCFVLTRKMGDAHYQMARRLLEAGAGPHILYDSDGEAIPAVCMAIRPFTLDLVLEFGASVAPEATGVASVFHHYRTDASYDVVLRVIGLGADLNARDENGKTPLMSQVAGRWWDGHRLDWIRTLVKYGADPKARCDRGKNVLHYLVDYLELHPKARRSFAPQAIHFLIFHGADPAARDADGKIPADECTIDEIALALNRKE